VAPLKNDPDTQPETGHTDKAAPAPVARLRLIRTQPSQYQHLSGGELLDTLLYDLTRARARLITQERAEELAALAQAVERLLSAPCT
jgi:hypothetical protein